MMCANELANVRNASMMKWENEKAEALACLAAASIEFCEKKIGPELERIARNPQGGIISVSHSLGVTWDSYNNRILCPICPDGEKYSDGTISKKLNTSVCYSQEMIEQYLSNHCLTVEWDKDSFSRYGHGSQPAMKLTVSVK